MSFTTARVEFEGSLGEKISARLDLPSGSIRAYAIFAHCFTCSKDLNATKKISAGLAEQGIAVLRFDFTGLGHSDGDFADTNFSSNQQDLVLAAKYLEDNYDAPSLLIGHSLGGAAVLAIGGDLDSVKAIVTIGAPAEAAHVVHNFGVKLDEISDDGKAEVELGGRTFCIQKQFLDDLEANNVLDKIAKLKKALMVLHSPIDQTVGIENASDIFLAAKHPKSFVSLDQADHLVSKSQDAIFVSQMISSWAEKYIPGIKSDETEQEVSPDAIVTETGKGKFQNTVVVNGHSFLADEPLSVGGTNTGPTPYDLLGASLGACTTMTLRMYANFKKLELGKISVNVSHKKVHMEDCEMCTDDEKSQTGKIDIFTRSITVEGDIDDALKAKLVEIADKCPVHKTLEKSAKVNTLYG